MPRLKRYAVDHILVNCHGKTIKEICALTGLSRCGTYNAVHRLRINYKRERGGRPLQENVYVELLKQGLSIEEIARKRNIKITSAQTAIYKLRQALREEGTKIPGLEFPPKGKHLRRRNLRCNQVKEEENV